MEPKWTLSFDFLRANGIDPEAAIAYLYEQYGFDNEAFVVYRDSIVIYEDLPDQDSNKLPDILESLIDPGFVANPSQLGDGD